MEGEHSNAQVSGRTRLAGLGGRQYWRSLEELARTREFEEFIGREFPEQAPRFRDEPTRREFLRLMAASMGVAGLTGCSRMPDERIVPYVVPPEQALPGKPLFFATAMVLGGYGRGVVVESHLGRPTKVEGNPQHPASLGAADVFAQASVLGLWDPDRAQVVSQGGQVSSWGAFQEAWSREEPRLRSAGGKGLRVLTETVTSPTLLDQLGKLLSRYPQAKWHHYEPLGGDGARAGSVLAFGRPLQTLYRLDRAERILSLDADFLQTDPGSLRYARDFIDRRRVRSPRDREGRPAGPGALSMNRLYMVQSSPTITGAMADHRLTVPAARVEACARLMAGKLGLGGGALGSGQASPEEERWMAAAVADLKKHPGAGLVIAGRCQPPSVHALAHALNEALGNAGSTVVHAEPAETHPRGPMDSLRELVRDMEAGQVDLLITLGANPAFSAPADLGFREALAGVKLRVHHGLYYDESSFLCHWHLPETHYLESWSDVRAYDGTVSIIQPLIAPLYQGRTAHQLLALLLGEPETAALAPVQAYWRERWKSGDFERSWEESLRSGVVRESALPPVQARVGEGLFSRLPAPAADPPRRGETDLEVIFRPDPAIWDGRFANNGWLMELPRPLTRLTWDNAAMLSPATARKLGVSSRQVVRLRYRGRELEAPAWVLPGQPDGSVTVHLGYGRERAGRVGTATAESGGFNGFRLRVSESPWFDGGLEVLPTPRHYPLACVQNHQLLEGPTRDLVRVDTIQRFAQAAASGGSGRESRPEEEVRFSLYPDRDYSQGHRWAMEIDNNSCIGCNACVVACQAENNIPIVGKKEVLNAREMHWLRIDTYFEGSPEVGPRAYFEPLPCMHCEKAPCEPVCPVGATTHSTEGLNEMTYNRCVGTRYCSNNCPYKVRRFNFYRYSDLDAPSLALQRNPEVTVRDRGVMEKCTYCVQRINHVRMDLKKLEVELQEARGEEEKKDLKRRMDARMAGLETACSQACPTRAIAFGDLNWTFAGAAGPEMSEVRKLRMQPQDFGLLTELNTEPRTRYLPRFRNPNEELEAPGGETPGARGG